MQIRLIHRQVRMPVSHPGAIHPLQPPLDHKITPVEAAIVIELVSHQLLHVVHGLGGGVRPQTQGD
eukprot:CAMPEP_0204498834 /NCGR_PEP_ID=MMETSP0471-20130131/93781_1 /ASSEMBLY_ACC=CAM_ASM_000602 /TAXON_ID=2969 /ORGANISM="Oxyrrhis marina" /LENGTH=65 /DNA_ID=CAMNT_0051503325 /DNA_START=21 /DNA_END=215 /DNA_ORIENTATION=-